MATTGPGISDRGWSQVHADARLGEVGVTEIITWSGGDSVEALLKAVERVREVVG